MKCNIPHSYRLWVLDKDLSAAHLVLIIVHVYRAQQMHDALLFASLPVWERLLGQDGIPKTHTALMTLIKIFPTLITSLVCT